MKNIIRSNSWCKILFVSLLFPTNVLAANLIIKEDLTADFTNEQVDQISLILQTSMSKSLHEETALLSPFADRYAFISKQIENSPDLGGIGLTVHRVPNILWDLYLMNYFFSNEPTILQIWSKNRSPSALYKEFVRIYLQQASQFVKQYGKAVSLDENRQILQRLQRDMVINCLEQSFDSHTPNGRLCSSLHNDLVKKITIYAKVLEIDQNALDNNVIVFYRGTGGASITSQDENYQYLDLPLGQFFQTKDTKLNFSDPSTLNEFTLSPGFSLAYTFFGGTIFDGFSRAAKSASTYVYYKTSAKYVYAITMTPEDFEKDKDLFHIPAKEFPVELTVFGGDDEFHPRIYGLDLEYEGAYDKKMKSKNELYAQMSRISNLFAKHVTIIENKSGLEITHEQLSENYRKLSKFLDQAAQHEEK